MYISKLVKTLRKIGTTTLAEQMHLSPDEFERIIIGPKWVQVAGFLNPSMGEYQDREIAERIVRSDNPKVAELLDKWVEEGRSYNKIRFDKGTKLEVKKEKAKKWVQTDEELDGLIVQSY